VDEIKSIVRWVIKTGGLSALLWVLISTSLYFVIFMYTNDMYPSIFFLLIVPTIIILLVGGALLIPILFIREERISNLRASLLGAIVGGAITSISIYIIWRMFLSYAFYSFFDFISPGEPTDFVWLVFYRNPFIIPSGIDILALAYVGWKTNNFKNHQISS
jgi:hypothetical protein